MFYVLLCFINKNVLVCICLSKAILALSHMLQIQIVTNKKITLNKNCSLRHLNVIYLHCLQLHIIFAVHE